MKKFTINHIGLIYFLFFIVFFAVLMYLFTSLMILPFRILASLAAGLILSAIPSFIIFATPLISAGNKLL